MFKKAFLLLNFSVFAKANDCCSDGSHNDDQNTLGIFKGIDLVEFCVVKPGKFAEFCLIVLGQYDKRNQA